MNEKGAFYVEHSKIGHLDTHLSFPVLHLETALQKRGNISQAEGSFSLFSSSLSTRNKWGHSNSLSRMQAQWATISENQQTP
jgi:hypothetical protein